MIWISPRCRLSFARIVLAASFRTVSRYYHLKLPAMFFIYSDAKLSYSDIVIVQLRWVAFLVIDFKSHGLRSKNAQVSFLLSLKLLVYRKVLHQIITRIKIPSGQIRYRS